MNKLEFKDIIIEALELLGSESNNYGQDNKSEILWAKDFHAMLKKVIDERLEKEGIRI